MGEGDRADRVVTVRKAIHAAIQRSIDVRGETFCEIAEDIWLVDGGVNLAWLAEAAVDALADDSDHKQHPILDREDTRSAFPEEVTEGDITVTIYKAEGAFVVADQAGWLPGSFPTRNAALAAARSENGLT